MRISSLFNYEAMLAQLSVNGTRISKLTEQMATQKRVNVPSDDPIAAVRLVQLNREQSAIRQYQSNITRVSGSLASQEANVKAISDQMLALSDKLISAANGAHANQDMQGYGVELSSMLDSLIAFMNAQNESGGYLFSGTKTDIKPIQWDEEQGKYIYTGNDEKRESQVANGITISENTDIATAFSTSDTDLAMLNKLKTLSEKMQDPAIPMSEYQDEITQLIDLTQTTRDNIGSVFTDLGSRQNRLTLLSDTHTDVSMANEQVIHELSDTDWATTSMNLQLYINSVQITNKAYNMISQLSLFSAM